MPWAETKNKRYLKTEKAILDVLAKSKRFPTAGALAKRAGISRTTLYRHHKTVPGIIPDYEQEILDKYTRTIRKMNRQKNVQVRAICLKSLIFIRMNRRIFKILLKYDDGTIIEKMVLKLKYKIKKSFRLSQNSDRMLRVYAKEVSGVIGEWGRQNFCEDEITATLNRVLYLTETMRQRLGPLNY